MRYFLFYYHSCFESKGNIKISCRCSSSVPELAKAKLSLFSYMDYSCLSSFHILIYLKQIYVDEIKHYSYSK